MGPEPKTVIRVQASRHLLQLRPYASRVGTNNIVLKKKLKYGVQVQSMKYECEMERLLFKKHYGGFEFVVSFKSGARVSLIITCN